MFDVGGSTDPVLTKLKTYKQSQMPFAKTFKKKCRTILKLLGENEMAFFVLPYHFENDKIVII